MRNRAAFALLSMVGIAVPVFAACGSDPPPVTPVPPAPTTTESASVASASPAPAPASASSDPNQAREAALAAAATMGSSSASSDFGDSSGPPTPPPAGTLSSGHHTAPTLRQGNVQVSGKLPPEVVQRIVRQNFGRFRLCYEKGLQRTSTLGGRVTVKFTIDASGAVQTAGDGGSDLPDATVVQCVVRGFSSLSFPQPDSGTVTVKYPIIFAPAP